MRRVLLALGVVVLVVVAVAAWLLQDLSRFTPRVEAAASRSLGRAVHLGGLRLRPDLSIEARDVTVANLPGGTRPDMLVVPRATARIGVGGLFGGTIDIREVTLERPDLLVERDNYLFRRAPTVDAAPVAPSSAPAFRAVLHEVTITDGRLRAGGREFAVPTASATLEADGWHATGTARAPEGTAELAGVWPTGGVARGDVTAHLTLPPAMLGGRDLGAFDAAVHVGPDPTRIRVIRGSQTLALETAPLATLQAPPDGVRPFDLALQQPGATAHAHGNVGPQRAFDAAFEARWSDLAPLSPLLPPGPGTASGHAAGSLAEGGRAGTVALDHLALATPIGDVAGDLTLSNVGVPSARGTLVSNRLDADALTVLVRRVVSNLAATPAPVPAAPPEPPHAVAVLAPTDAATPLPFGLLDAATGDLTLSAETLILAGATFHGAHVHATLADGRLALDPVVAGTEAGAATASLHVDSRSAPPAVKLMLQAPSLQFATASLSGAPLTGDSSIRADLTAAGADVPELLQSLGGSASAALVDGEVDNALAGPLLAKLFPRLPIRLNGAEGTTHVRCAVARAVFAGGSATVAPLALDTTRLLAVGEGTVDLKARAISIRVRPVLQAGLGISVPLLVSGAWRAPRVDPDPQPLPLPAGDVCAAGLAAIGRPLPPPAVAVAPGKPKKPADLLRSLFR